MTDFKSLLTDLQQQQNPINVAIPQLGIVTVVIKSIQEDIVSLKPTPPHTENIIYLHYTSVIIVT